MRSRRNVRTTLQERFSLRKYATASMEGAWKLMPCRGFLGGNREIGGQDDGGEDVLDRVHGGLPLIPGAPSPSGLDAMVGSCGLLRRRAVGFVTS